VQRGEDAQVGGVASGRETSSGNRTEDKALEFHYLTSKVSHSFCRLPSGLSKRDHTIRGAVCCRRVATDKRSHAWIRKTHSTHGRPGSNRDEGFSVRHNVVAMRMLQIQHTHGNLLLTPLNGQLKSRRG